MKNIKKLLKKMKNKRDNKTVMICLDPKIQKSTLVSCILLVPWKCEALQKVFHKQRRRTQIKNNLVKPNGREHYIIKIWEGGIWIS